MTTSMSLIRLALAATIFLSAIPNRPAAAQCMPTAELVAGDRAANDHFGEAVAISGDTAVVGAPQHADPSTSSYGAAYVFVRNGSSWTQQAKLFIPGEQGAFGASVAILGNTIAVCGYTSHNAYVFTRSGTTWSLQTTLPNTDDQFTSVALGSVGVSRLVAVVGARYAPANGLNFAGAARIYTLDTLHVGSVWTQVARLTAPDAAAGDGFGISVAVSGGISGATAIIAAPYKNNASGVEAGAAYVYTSNNVGSGWAQQAELIAMPGFTQQHLGLGGVSINGDTAVIVELNMNTFFTRTGTTWTRHQFLWDRSGSVPAFVRLFGDVLIAGGDIYFQSGSAWANVYTRPTGSGIGGTWVPRLQLVAPAPLAEDFLHSPADYSGTTAVLGVVAQVGNGNPGTQFPSAAYIFNTYNPCPPDFDCNGTVSVNDIFAFLSAWFAASTGADFTGDSIVAVNDIFAFLGAWFAGCP